MKAKTRIKLLLAFVTVMAAALIGGCSIGLPDYDETLEQKNITSLVTYYGNGGYFNNSTGILYRLVGSEDGTAFYNIQSTGTSQTVTRGSGWTFVGWYYIQTVQIETDGETEDYYVCEDDTVASDFTITEDGEEREVVIDYGGQLVISRTDYELLVTRYADLASELPMLKLDGQVDTSMRLTEGHIYVAADWVVAQGVNYQLVMADGGSKITYSYTTTDADGNAVTASGEFSEGEIIYTDYFGTSSSLSVLTSSPINTLNNSYTLTDGTWLEYYYDEACTQVASGTVAKPESGDLTIYVLFTPGLWEVVKDASGVRGIFSSTSDDYYILNDIDCSDANPVTAMTSFSGTIKGNGHTISGLTVRAVNISTGSYAMFGELRRSASITDITFDNLTVNYTTREAYTGSYTPYIYFLFRGVSSGATPTISGVKITNSTMNLTVESGVTVMNIQSETDTDSWLYAVTRESGETDADFEAAYGGVSFDNVKLIYNESEIAVISADN